MVIQRSESGSSLPPPPADNRNALLDSIRQGTHLRHVTPISQEERKQQLQEASIKSNQKDGLMNALAGALAARRTKIVTDLASNPFGDNDDEEEDWE